MKIDKKQYDVANLSNTPIQQVRSLEKTLSEEKGEEVVLIAYSRTSEVEDTQV